MHPDQETTDAALERKYIYNRDSLQATWGDPEELAEHADKAVDAVTGAETIQQITDELKP